MSKNFKNNTRVEFKLEIGLSMCLIKHPHAPKWSLFQYFLASHNLVSIMKLKNKQRFFAILYFCK